MDAMDLIKQLEVLTENPEEPLDVDKMVQEYKRLYYLNPIFHLVEDIERQAMLYSNVIEQIKSGDEASEIRNRFERLGVLPGASLPNPSVPALMQKAFDKISTFRKALVDIIKKYGSDLLRELSFELEQTVSVGVNIGFPPSVSIAVEQAAKITRVT